MPVGASLLSLALLLLAAGLWNTESIDLTAKGFYGMSFLLSLFGAVAVQKNVRDLALFKDETPLTEPESAA